MPRIDQPSTMEIHCLGIDPGAKGGLAALSLDGKNWQLTAMPESEEEVLAWFAQYERRAVAVQELVGGFMPGSKGNIGSAMFAFGWSACIPWMALTVCKIRRVKKQPNVWQKALGIIPRKKGKKAESKSQFKSRLRRFAQQLFPTLADDITNSTCDALLIAEYCRRLVKKGDL